MERLTDRRPEAIEEHLRASRLTGMVRSLSPAAWAVEELPGPNVGEKATVLALAQMTANAYIMVPGTEKWLEVGAPYNHSQNFGWEDDGLRGHIYADNMNGTVIVSLKGTSGALFDGEGTTTNDKLNDNLFFSCCCGQGGQYLWRQVCDCYTDTYTCNSTCVTQSLLDENRYYRAALDLYSNVTAVYPNSNVWVVGHSLGGAVSSMLGLTYGLPVVTFEAVPEALPASRLGLPVPAGENPALPQRRLYSGAYHFGHTADPIYMGTCNGMTSVCTLGGYAMESQCHTGYRCVYDTVEDLGWRVGIGTHRILAVISDVIERYDTVPTCARDRECVDCFNWKFFESNGSEPTTTSSSMPSTTSLSATRTSTCQTPGWWGCLDPTTTATTTGTPSTISTTSTSSTCKTPGWFGCKDPTTTPSPTATVTATRTATTTSTSTSTSTCKTPGWFGCYDPTTTIPPPTPSPSLTAGPTATSTSTTCQTPGWWGCRDPTTTQSATGPDTITWTRTQTLTKPATTTTLVTSSCQTPGWFGCYDPTTTAAETTATSSCHTPGWFGCYDQPATSRADQ